MVFVHSPKDGVRVAPNAGTGHARSLTAVHTERHDADIRGEANGGQRLTVSGNLQGPLEDDLDHLGRWWIQNGLATKPFEDESLSLVQVSQFVDSHPAFLGWRSAWFGYVFALLYIIQVEKRRRRMFAVSRPDSLIQALKIAAFQAE
jgi:hypothetical protein